MRVALTTIVCLALLACASGAQAAQRYASPEGKGVEPCVQAAPCSLKDAISGAKAEDEVIVGSGSYVVSSAIVAPAKGLYIHGDFGGPMPQINASVLGPPIAFIENAQHIAYLEVINTTGESAWGFVCTAGWRIERVRVLALAATSPIGIYQNEGCLVRDSVVRAQGTSAFAINTNGTSGAAAVDRNLTVVASGAGAVGVAVFNSGSAAIDVKNSILAGDAFDVRVASKGRAFFGNSNFDSPKVEPEGLLIDLGGNQTAAPLFVDAAKADYREAAGSPTIDAGVENQLGALDLGGNARVIGAAVDIGAFEFLPTPPPPPPPSPASTGGQIQSLALAPSSFSAVKSGEAILSAKKKAKAPLGTTVTYSLSAKATAEFSVERAVSGRNVKGRCAKVTKANRFKKKCQIFTPVSGSFTHSGATGANSFKFSGRVGGKGLAPGAYRLVGSAGGASKTANFKIVK